HYHIELRPFPTRRSSDLTALTADLQTLNDTEQQIVARSKELEQVREQQRQQAAALSQDRRQRASLLSELDQRYQDRAEREKALGDRKSTRLNSSHVKISY